eukprot:1189402-Prymnesium_polylepis.1
MQILSHSDSNFDSRFRRRPQSGCPRCAVTVVDGTARTVLVRLLRDHRYRSGRRQLAAATCSCCSCSSSHLLM